MKPSRAYGYAEAVGDALAEVQTGRPPKPRTPPSGPRRLVTDTGAAEYLNASRSYVRALIANGVLRRVELPPTDGTRGRARMLRIDIRDLDAFVDRMKT